MKSASRLFFLSIFALWSPLGRCQSQHDACLTSPKAIVSDACVSYAALEKLNDEVHPALDDLTRTTDFFSYYRINLFHSKCPFWDDENGMCGNIACAVQTLENEDDIPTIWRASALGRLEGPSAEHPAPAAQRARPRRPLEGRLGEHVGESCVVEYDDDDDDYDGDGDNDVDSRNAARDYCVPEDDESAGAPGDYVSLLDNPERFTGYAGDGARQVWEAIYRENCFQRSSFPHAAQLGAPPAQLANPAALDFRSVLEAAGRQAALAEHRREKEPQTPFVARTGLEVEDECIEKRVFYRLMSGMHASISTHLCWDFLNQTTGQWTPNVACYEERLHRFPERISNLYFNYALVTRAVAKLGPRLAEAHEFTFCSGEPAQDAETRAKVGAVTAAAASVPQLFDESLLFVNGEGPSLKEDFRQRFRNVSRLMDCVGCDKCRLWGKLQTAGYGTALKVLFESDNAGAVPALKRTELVALFNTYARLSSSMEAIQKFREMVAADGGDEGGEDGGDGNDKAATTASSTPHTLPDRVRLPHHVPPLKDNAAAATAAEATEVYEETLREVFDEELGRVIKAFRIVLQRWAAFPQTLWAIVTSELVRFWEFFVGLPVRPRTWKFERPSLDEL